MAKGWYAVSDLVINGNALDMQLAAFQGRKYKLIAADPPWWYNERNHGDQTKFGEGASYDLMTTDQIAAMPVAQLTADQCLLTLWATCPLLPDALEVMAAWDFHFVTVGFVWVKANAGLWEKLRAFVSQLPLFPPDDGQLMRMLDNLAFFGPGYYTGSNAELVLFGRRGDAPKHAEGHKASQMIFAPRGDHSAKPEAMQDRLEWMYPQLTPRLELFARRERAGWDVFGNEV